MPFHRVALSGEGRRAEFAGGNIAESDPAAGYIQINGSDVIGAGVLQHGAFRHCARCDDPDHAPFHQALHQVRVFQLLADGDLISFGNEFGNIRLGGMERNSPHGSLFFLGLSAIAGRQGKIQFLGCNFRIVIEQFVKIAQPEKQQTVLMFLLDLIVLFFHGS